MTGRTPIFQRPERNSITIFGAGSIFRHIKAADSALVWGSGLISKDDTFKSPKHILAVRGPLTKKILDKRSILCPDSFGDPGLMLAQVFKPKDVGTNYALGIVPHFKEVNIVTNLYAKEINAGEVRLIDPTQPIEEVVKQVLACQVVVSSSLHGIIICHAYGIRCGWVRFSPLWDARIEGDDMKFFDHFSAIGLESHAQGPLTIDGAEASIKSLLTYASKSPVPDPTGLIQNLQRTCPFS